MRLAQNCNIPACTTNETGTESILPSIAAQNRAILTDFKGFSKEATPNKQMRSTHAATNPVQDKGTLQRKMEIVETPAVMTDASHRKSDACPSRVALRTFRKCPACDKTLRRHTLLYRHKCKGDPEMGGKALLERMDERIKRRFGPFSETDVLDCPPTSG